MGCGVSGEGKTDASALVDVGDLQAEVEDARLSADWSGRAQGDDIVGVVQGDPATGVVQEPLDVAVDDPRSAPAAVQGLLRAAAVECLDERPVREGRGPDADGVGGVQQLVHTPMAARRASRW